jgi:hypothetical protein
MPGQSNVIPPEPPVEKNAWEELCSLIEGSEMDFFLYMYDACVSQDAQCTMCID